MATQKQVFTEITESIDRCNHTLPGLIQFLKNGFKKLENASGGGGGGSTVEWTQIQASGTKIAEIEIDGDKTSVYAPTGGGGDISAEDVSYGSGTVKDALDKAGKFIKLWENPNPSEAFSEQTITLASDDYDLLLMMARNQSGIVSTIAPKGNGIWLCYANGNITSERRALYISTTSLKIQDATANNNVNNNAVIPFAVYGIKL